ncbi:hypothetical protein SMC26_33010 [Actinomadura fulvescens]|uniref:Uncharacterized protein n=1 Tax=Actinomadura fulvescens TaxID=46160 RepID=A0ABN3QBF4_9ACTN
MYRTASVVAALAAALAFSPTPALATTAPAPDEGQNVNFDIAQIVWTSLVSTALKPLCLDQETGLVTCPADQAANNP